MLPQYPLWSQAEQGVEAAPALEQGPFGPSLPWQGVARKEASLCAAGCDTDWAWGGGWVSAISCLVSFEQLP